MVCNCNERVWNKCKHIWLSFNYSPSAELKNSVFVGKNFYKPNTLANVSLGYVDHVEKLPYLSQMGKPRLQALFLNDACAIW